MSLASPQAQSVTARHPPERDSIPQSVTLTTPTTRAWPDPREALLCEERLGLGVLPESRVFSLIQSFEIKPVVI